MSATDSTECGTCPHLRSDHRTIGLPCVGGLLDCPCTGFQEPGVVHPDDMTGEGVLAAILANPEPPAWYERQQVELCSDKNGFHDGHDWTPDPCEPYRWCPGYPVPARG